MISASGYHIMIEVPFLAAKAATEKDDNYIMNTEVFII